MITHQEDRYAWAIETARRLRTGEPVDTTAIAHEIEHMSSSDARELESRITQILEHLLKLRLVSGPVLEYNQRGWNASIARQRAELEILLEESPSLKARINQGLLAKRYPQAARAVTLEYAVEAPVACPFTVADLLS